MERNLSWTHEIPWEESCTSDVPSQKAEKQTWWLDWIKNGTCPMSHDEQKEIRA
jgi:hypothetical protein